MKKSNAEKGTTNLPTNEEVQIDKSVKLKEASIEMTLYNVGRTAKMKLRLSGNILTTPEEAFAHILTKLLDSANVVISLSGGVE